MRLRMCVVRREECFFSSSLSLCLSMPSGFLLSAIVPPEPSLSNTNELIETKTCTSEMCRDSRPLETLAVAIICEIVFCAPFCHSDESIKRGECERQGAAVATFLANIEHSARGTDGMDWCYEEHNDIIVEIEWKFTTFLPLHCDFEQCMGTDTHTHTHPCQTQCDL